MKLLLQNVPPRQGLQWMRESFSLFARKPLALSVVLMVYLLATLALLWVPMVGPLLALAYLPLLSLAYMTATKQALAGELVSPAALFTPWLQAGPAQRRTLLITCFVFAALTAALMALAQAVDGGGFAKLQTLSVQPRTEATTAEMNALMSSPGFITGLWLRFGGTALLSIPFWFAPALIAWHNQGTVLQHHGAVAQQRRLHLVCAGVLGRGAGVFFGDRCGLWCARPSSGGVGLSTACRADLHDRVLCIAVLWVSGYVCSL
jgi:hypothetical protein